jgi:hypothetical protein
MYDEQSKKPNELMSERINPDSLKAGIKDANDENVATLSDIHDSSFGVPLYSFTMSINFKESFYKVENIYTSNLVLSTTIFVMSLCERRNVVILDVNENALTMDDEVIGKVTLNMLTKEDECFLKEAFREKLN